MKDNKIIEEGNDGKAEFKRKQENTVREVVKCIIHNHKSPTVEVKEDSSKQNNDFKCEMCDYSCKKDNIMKKHMNT